MTRSGARSGVTLFELMVVILLLGLLSGVVGLTMGSTPRVPSLDSTTVAVLQARDSALRTGHPVTIAFSHEPRAARTVPRHVTHLAVAAMREPALEPRRVGAERDVAHPERVEAARGGECGEVAPEAGEVGVHGAPYTTRP